MSAIRNHMVLLLASTLLMSASSPILSSQGQFTDWMLTARKQVLSAEPASRNAQARHAWTQLHELYPLQWDWLMQDAGEDFVAWFSSQDAARIESRLLIAVGVQQTGVSSTTPEGNKRALDLYVGACETRRKTRLGKLVAGTRQVVFTKHRTIRPSFFAYTEGQSDAQNERHFLPHSELCLLELDGIHGTVRTLVKDLTGAIRDPALSWDGERVLFAWKKSLDQDDYHIYEYNLSSGAVRQLTFGLGFADYEPAWLPNGDIIFSSTRCVQTVDCWWTEASNLYACDPDGRYLRRLTFDQVHAVFPQVMDDGRVIYTRWDYNDRGQIFPQALFQMNADGTGQVEFYGNNSWFPTTIAHARGIPGSQKVLAILCGHHSSQAGKLAVIDPARGRQENAGVQLVAPVRVTPAERVDAYGQQGPLWQYPYPLDEREFLTTFAPLGWDRPEKWRGDAAFGIYWMDMDGNRELLAADSELPCSQPIPIRSKQAPVVRPSKVDYSKGEGIYYMQDVYSGPGLSGVPRGSITHLRAIALDFRAAGVGNNSSEGPGGGALISTPISIGNGAWDVKIVLGEARVYPDGSALFSVPARTPVYFQALDERGRAVQTMRSWSTLQPGETSSCVGCHDAKNSAPALDAYAASMALKAGIQELRSHRSASLGFSFSGEVQPVLDRHCTRCHDDRRPVDALARGETSGITFKHSVEPLSSQTRKAFSLLGDPVLDDSAKRYWCDSYLVLTQSRRDGSQAASGPFRGNPRGPIVSWIGSQSVPEPLPPRFAGSVRSFLLTLIDAEHGGVKLSPAEYRTLACWIDLLVPYCGDYREANAWTPAERERYDLYLAKRQKMEALEAESVRVLASRQRRQP